MSIPIGELIRWHEVYDDFICADSGIGIVLRERLNTAVYLDQLNLTAYEVYRFKHSDTRMYQMKDIELLQQETQNG